MKPRVLVIGVLTLLAVTVTTAASHHPVPGTLSAPTVLAASIQAGSAQPGAKADLRLAMRKLWEDHITYTRHYIISAVADLPDADSVAKRLLQNQDDIGNAIKPYYDDAAGEKLAALPKDHITIATEVVKAAKTGNTTALDAAQKKWTLETMLQKHFDLTSGGVVARLKRDWAADIKAYDDGHAHMLMFADALTDGIAKQYPAKFKD